MMMETTFGLGFFTASEIARYGGTAAFGHTGAGGSMGFTDPEHGISFGYVMNRMALGLTGDPTPAALIPATHARTGLTPTSLCLLDWSPTPSVTRLSFTRRGSYP